MKIKANWFTQPEHPESSSPNPESVPNSCWFCGFAPDGDKKVKKEKSDKGEKCPRCGMWTLQNPSDPILLTDPSVQDGPMESSVVVNVSHKQASDFSKGLTPESINQFKSEMQVLGLPLDKLNTIIRIIDDHRAMVQQQQQQMQQTQQQQTYQQSQYPTMKPPGGSRINATDIIREELKNKIEEVVDKLVDQGADEDDAKNAVKALVDKELDVVAALEKVSVWAEPPVEHDYTPPLAESSKAPLKKLRKVVRKKKR